MGLYRAATKGPDAVRDLCRVAFSHVGLEWEEHVHSAERFMRPTEIAASKGDYSKAKAELGWEPEETFESGMAKTVAWYIDNESWWRPLKERIYDGARLGLKQ